MFKKLAIWIFLITTFGVAETGRYRLMWRDDPSTTMVIGWEQQGGNNAEVFYDTLDHGQDLAFYPFHQGPDETYLFKGMVNSFARLTGLKPNTAYYFVIRDSDGKSPRFWFRTAPDTAQPFSYIAGGDSRNNRDARKRANAMVAKLRPLFIGFGGDFTDADISGQWKAWFDDWQDTISSDGRMYPILVVKGNHERTNEVLVHLFDFPHENIYGAFSFGGNLLRYYILNTDIPRGGEQAAWFERDLVSHGSTKYRIVQYHKPIRPHVARKRDQESQYRIWAPLFYHYQVQLAIQCDSHCAVRTWPIRPTRVPGNDEGYVRDDMGTVYVGEGCWGAPLRDPDDPKSWTRDVGKFNQFKWIHVYPDKMELRSIKVDDVDESGSVSEDDLMALPENLPVWDPSNGAVVILPARQTLTE
jgi:acid phosphatase type 7